VHLKVVKNFCEDFHQDRLSNLLGCKAKDNYGLEDILHCSIATQEFFDILHFQRIGNRS